MEEEKKITAEPLAKLSHSVWEFTTLLAGIKLDIFKFIKEKSTAEEIAKKLNIDKDPAERLLNALTAMNLIKKEDNYYENLPIANKYLIKDLPSYYGDFILMNAESIDRWKNLDKAIIENKPLIGDINERLSRPFFTRAMHNNAQAPAKRLSNLFDFSNKKHFLDIGAGAGTFSIVLTNKYPNLKTTAIEQPEVCKIIKEYVKKEGNPEKIEIIGGDFFKLDFPNHDVALFGQIFHQYSAEENKTLLKKVYEKLEDEGNVIITEFLMDDDKSGPVFPAIFALNMLKESKEGNAYTFLEIKSWLKEIGFKDIEKKHLIGPHTAIISKK